MTGVQTCALPIYIGYDGYTCIEVEDKAYEASIEDAKRAVKQSVGYLRNFVG